jgi:F-type H+-transporting ATPase subunit epsilon
VLIKRDDEVLVSAVNGVTGADLGQLHQTVREEFKSLDERDRRARSALARMEADFVRRFMELR